MPSRQKTDEDDVVEEYDIFITPDLAEKMLVLQYPLRDAKVPYSQRTGSAPIGMRIKPESGFVEVDTKLDPDVRFNKEKGLQWGAAMKKAKGSGLTTFGASAGFGPGTVKLDTRRPRLDEYGDPMEDFHDALRRGEVFSKQTLGGQIIAAEDGKPQYMLGAFHGKELHLTKVDGIAQMRPNFHHIDAQAHVEKASMQREPDEVRPPQARAFTQSYKSAREGAATRDRNLMQVAQEEKWTSMSFFDDEASESYAAYDATFPKNAFHSEPLQSTMKNEEYLDAISAPRHDPSGRRKKKPLTKKQREAIEVAEDNTDPVDDLPAD